MAIDGQPVQDNATLFELLAHRVNARIQVELERRQLDEHKPDRSTGPLETLTIDVPPNPLRTFGLSMKIGPITAIQDQFCGRRPDSSRAIGS